MLGISCLGFNEVPSGSVPDADQLLFDFVEKIINVDCCVSKSNPKSGSIDHVMKRDNDASPISVDQLDVAPFAMRFDKSKPL